MEALSNVHGAAAGSTGPMVMGIINVTPDSFSDGGRFLRQEEILAQADRLVADGADVLDIGGESSRPFAEPVPAAEELERVIPAIQAIRRRHPVPISIDTTKAVVAREAVEAGAAFINDISSFRFDREMIAVARETEVPIIIMHMQGTPRDMQLDPTYEDVMAEVTAFLKERIEWAERQGVDRARLIIDPGIGFGKALAHNLTLLKHLADLQSLGCPILVGHSRKAFIGKILDLPVAAERDAATAVLSALCAAKGAAYLRVHEVKQTKQAIRLLQAVESAA